METDPGLNDGPSETAEVIDMPSRTHHRVRFYPGKWSTFDSIVACPTGPKTYCWGCEYKHPHCDQNGRTNALAKS